MSTTPAPEPAFPPAEPTPEPANTEGNELSPEQLDEVAGGGTIAEILTTVLTKTHESLKAVAKNVRG